MIMIMDLVARIRIELLILLGIETRKTTHSESNADTDTESRAHLPILKQTKRFCDLFLKNGFAFVLCCACLQLVELCYTNKTRKEEVWMDLALDGQNINRSKSKTLIGNGSQSHPLISLFHAFFFKHDTEHSQILLNYYHLG